MKLHLPVALLTAVISAMAYGAEPAYTIDRTMGSDIQGGTYHDNDVIVDVTGGDFAKYNMGGDWTHRADFGAIQGASETDVMPHDHDNPPTYGDIYLNVSGGENISWLIGEGVPTPVKVTGDKHINVTGGDIDYIVGGVHYRNNSNGFTGVGNTTTVLDAKGNPGTAEWAHKDASNPDINISVTGGTVGQIRGGNNNKSDNVYNSLKYALGQGKDLMTDKPWAVAGDVNISVGGDAVVGDGTKAIAGAGGSGHSVDGKVTVNVTGGTINGAIYGGSTNIYTEVGSTEVNISGGTINGNVYGGGNYDDGADKAAKYGLDPAVGPTVKGDSTVVLSGGTVNGSVYAAGDKDIVEGDTRVVINGTQAKVTGDISGGGINGADVQGNSILAIKNSGGLGVSWDQFKDVNALEIENSQLALGTPDSGHKLSSQFQNVSVEHSNIFGNIDHEVLFKANDSVVDIKGSFTTVAGSSITNTDGAMTVGGEAKFNGTKIDDSSIVAGGAVTIGGDSQVSDSSITANGGKIYVQEGSDITNSHLTGSGVRFEPGTGTTMTGGTITAVNGTVQLKDANVSIDGLTAGRVSVLEGSSMTMNEGSFTVTKDPASSAVVWIRGGELTVDKGAELKSTNNSAVLHVQNGTLKVDNGSTVDFSKSTSTIVGEYTNKADLTEGHIILDNGSKFIGSPTNTWLTSGSIELYGGSTMGLCTESKADHNYRTIIGVYDSNEFEIVVSEGSKLTSSAYALVTNYMSNTDVTIKVDGAGSSFTQTAQTTWGRDTNTYLLDSGVDNKGNKPIPTSNNAVLNVTASNGGHFNIESGVTYIGSAQDKEIYGEHLNKTANFTISGEGSKVSFNQLEVYANTNIINADGTFKATDITVHEDAVLTHTGSGKLTANSLTVNGAMKFGSTEGGRSQMEIANDASMANSTITNADVKVGGALTLNKGNVAGSTLTSTGGNMYIQDASTVTDSKLSATNIGIYDGSVVNGGTITAGKVVQLEGATVTTEGLSAQRLNVYEGSNLTLNGGSHTLSKNGAALVIKGDSTMLVDNGAVVKSTQNTAQMAIESGTLKVDNGSTVDFSKGQTTIVGEYVNKADAAEGHIILDNGSTFIGGATNAWLTSGSVELYGDSSMELCTSSKADHNYRTIIGLYDSNEFDILVSEGSTLTSSAYALVTNYMSNTTVNIKVDGVGADGKASTFTQKALTSWGRDTNTYLLDSGVDNNGNKPIPTSNNAVINVTASNGGHFNIESGMTYIGSAQDHEIYGDNLNKTANFTISGEGSKVSFKDVQVYANTVIENEGGSFTAEDLKVHEGATFSHEGNGKITASSIAVDGTMLIGSEDGGRSQMTLNVPVTGTASYSGKINGQLTINNADFIVKGEDASQFGIGIGGEGSMLVTGGSDVNLSRGTTLVLGRDGGAGKLTVADGSVLKGGSNNLWVYGNSEIHVTEGSNMEVCSGGDHNNYRVLLGLTNTGDATTEQTILVDKGASFTSHAYEFVSHFHGGSTVNIVADGANSTFTQANTMNTGTFMGTNKTTTYLLDSGYDSKGNKYGAVDHVKANITASNGGKVSFDSDVTYVGSAQDKAAGYTDKKLNISVDSTSSMTFGDMVIYADTTINNKGSLTVDDITVYDGATVENLGSLSLDEVVLSDATLYNAGELAMNSLVMDNATLLFAATALDSCSTFIYNGAGLTGYGISNVSAADMIQNFGIVMSGPAAAGLLQQWGAEVEFSFTLAQGSDQFEKEFAYVLEQNLADFTITLGDVAELTVGADEIKDLKVEDTANGVVISGIAVIPEPTTATLSLLALAALAARRRRK